jgi:hypothetical protein
MIDGHHLINGVRDFTRIVGLSLLDSISLLRASLAVDPSQIPGKGGRTYDAILSRD